MSNESTQASPGLSYSGTITYRRALVNGVGIFYREAGPVDAPTIVLLHGFPSSSRMFDTLIPLLAARYHLIAPDYPGFGHSDAPPPARFAYTFDHLAESINGLLEQLGIDRYSFYLQDYGGPVGFRIMLAHPERLQTLVIQNANSHEESLGRKWAAIREYWANPAAKPEVFEAFVSFEATRFRHAGDSPHPERYNPDTWTDEFAFLNLPGQAEIQAALLYDYRTNVAAYPAWQAWLRAHRPRTLVMWGRYDSSFVAAAGGAYQRDLPDAEVHLLDAGHFALDEKVDDIAALMHAFLAKHLA
ncbi:alpha/beta hydrolase [Paraburkholderia guartelaensis]|uniref:Alpha/beta hydrolase n=1 Tax=Paraburkholderia guartelaensis TaxID=2546446 RepID=A0A4R5L584_9BURK|nr:alpha/beta hydrolase [Paraburkholderia guartelaensis]TDG03925.1 alpha/beta hydrolase [Paraburkholderia guartelaensis]